MTVGTLTCEKVFAKYELSWKYSEVYQNSKLPFTIAEDKYNI